MGKKAAIRKVIDRDDLQLPKVWANFLASDENKQDLANYLSGKLVQCEIPGKEVVVKGSESGPFSSQGRPLPSLDSNHEEADTSLILHALDGAGKGFQRIVLQCRDTGVLLLLIYFLGNHPSRPEVWLKSGTARQMQHYPVHDIAKELPAEVMRNILGFHALTGCDTVSSFGGFGKKSCW